MFNHGGRSEAAHGDGMRVSVKDGHTLLVGPDTVLTSNPHLYKRMGLDLPASPKPVTYLASFNQVLVCHPGVGVALIEKFRQLPSSRSYASGGPGSPSHMAMEMLLTTVGTKFTHVPYKAPGLAALDVMAGTVDCGFIVGSVVLPHIQAGKLQAIAVSGHRRSALLAQTPTGAETGHPGFDATLFETLMAPPAMPPALVEKVQRDVRSALNTAPCGTAWRRWTCGLKQPLHKTRNGEARRTLPNGEVWHNGQACSSTSSLPQGGNRPQGLSWRLRFTEVRDTSPRAVVRL